MVGTPDQKERDRDLVRRFQAGDGHAFDRLVELYRRDTYRLAFRLLGNHEDADDLAQEAFLRAYRSLGRFRGEATFRTWLTRIVLNLASDRRRSLATSRQVPWEELTPGQEPSQAPMNAAGLIQGEALRQAVQTLPPRQRETLILRMFQDMKFQEIASAMGCTVGTAKANFFHAVRGLRERAGVTLRPTHRGSERQGKNR